MAFTDPQSIDIGAGAVSLPRVSSGLYNTVYTDATGNLSYAISHQYKNRTRRLVRVDVRKTAADPLFPTNFLPYTASVYLVIDVPKFGFTATEQKTISTGLMTNLTASTNANLIKVTQGES